jgi:penicillin-binding protein 1A
MARTPWWRKRRFGLPKLKKIWPWLAAGLAVLLATGFGFFLWVESGLPKFDRLTDYRPKLCTKLFDPQGREVGAFFHERRTVVPMAKIPKLLRSAVVSAEDKDFFTRSSAISLSGIARAAIKHYLLGGRIEGGSTITQQVVKTFLLSPERTFIRKFKEAILAERIGEHLSKEEILYLYLNQIYLGHQRYGVEEASLYYFGKHVWDLGLGEIALLAGMPQSPQSYSPIHHPEAAKRRQLYVLHRMREDGAITEKEEQREAAKPILVHPPADVPGPFYVEEVRRYLEARYGVDLLYDGGLMVVVGMDPDLQAAAPGAIEKGLHALEQREHLTGPGHEQEEHPEAALVALDPHSRRVLALVGGSDFKKSSFDRAVQAKRQPGSAFKPFVYAAAIDSGRFTAASVLLDAPQVIHDPSTGKDWKPENYEMGTFDGPVTLRRALSESKNSVAVRLIEALTPAPVIELAHKMGIVSELPDSLTLGLGSGEVSLLELVNAYAVFDDGGLATSPVMVLEVRDQAGKVLEESRPAKQPALRPDVAYILTDLLTSVIQDDTGTGARARSLPGPLAGKTGTPSDYRDAWFVGYSADLVVGVWVGFDDHRSLGPGETGGHAALPIWIEFMAKALTVRPPAAFPIPPTVVFARIDAQTGKLARPEDLQARQEPFLPGTAPTELAAPPGQARQKDLFLRGDNPL